MAAGPREVISGLRTRPTAEADEVDMKFDFEGRTYSLRFFYPDKVKNGEKMVEKSNKRVILTLSSRPSNSTLVGAWMPDAEVIAYRHEGDQFDKAVGRTVAFRKLLALYPGVENRLFRCTLGAYLHMSGCKLRGVA